MVHEFDCHGKRKEKNNAKGKRACHKDKIFAACFSMMDSSAVSTLNHLVPAAFRTGCVSLAFPETAANGETFAAFLPVSEPPAGQSEAQQLHPLKYLAD